MRREGTRPPCLLAQVHKHVLAGAYQLAALRDAAAMAKALDRILILPKVWAWCDSDSMLTIMRNCTFDGSEHYPPWQAPGDLFFNMDVRSHALVSPGVDDAVRCWLTGETVLDSGHGVERGLHALAALQLSQPSADSPVGGVVRVFRLVPFPRRAHPRVLRNGPSCEAGQQLKLAGGYS